MNLKEMVAEITREILSAMHQEKQQNQPKVLYIFCDSTAHEAYLDHFIKLKGSGIAHDLLFLDGETSSWLGMNKLECGGAGKCIASDEFAPAPLELPKEYDAFVIPEIDLDNAARVAAGLKGTIKAEIIFAALVLQKPVFVGSDVPGIKRADRRTLQAVTLPVGYQKLFARHMAAMKELGVEFRLQSELADSVIAVLKARQQAEPASDADVISGDTQLFSGKLLTADWLKTQPNLPTKSLNVQKGTIISPLAVDVLREKGIALQVVEKG